LLHSVSPWNEREWEWVVEMSDVQNEFSDCELDLDSDCDTDCDPDTDPDTDADTETHKKTRPGGRVFGWSGSVYH
jgi:hypothetical protein